MYALLGRWGIIVLLLLAITGVFAADGTVIAESMDVDSSDLLDAEILGAATAYDAMTGLGVLTPQAGTDFAYLFTGKIGTPPQSGMDISPYGQAGDQTTLSLQLEVPDWAHSFVFDFYFMSAEYPEFVGTMYNDSFTAYVSGSAWSGDVAVDNSGNPISINSVLFTVTSSTDLLGTGYDGTGGGTGWLTIVVPADPGDTITLTFDIHDVADGIYDSGVLLDNFQWDDDSYEEPVLIEDIIVDFLSPKTGGLEGGGTTTVVGDRFNESCSVLFDGAAAETTYIDSEHLEVVIPPHSTPELVDVEVVCVGADETLVGGYTYYDIEEGTAPPVISAVNPYSVGLEGGVEIEIEGEGFVPGAQVFIDEVPVETTFYSPGAVGFVAPAHDAGLASVILMNPDQLYDIRVGALFYMDEAIMPSEGSLDTDGATADDSVDLPSNAPGCASIPVAGAPWLGGLSALASIAALLRRAGRGGR